jgi:hypothetical protein
VIEYLLNWIAAVLQENKDPMTVGEIASHMDFELQTARHRLDVLLSLDQRFRRVGQNRWSFNTASFYQSPASSKGIEVKSDLHKLVEKSISLRQQAIDSLLGQRNNLQGQVSIIKTRLKEIQLLLIGLDYDQSLKGHSQATSSMDRRSTETVRNKDQRYRSVWPLPGERVLLLDNLAVILNEIEQQNLTMEELVHWFQKYFKVGNWANNSIVACVFYPGFAKRIQNHVVLTELGRDYLTGRDTSLVVNALRKSFWGIEELLSWLEEQPMTMDQLQIRFNSIGAGWKKIDQIRYRLNWLLAAGLVGSEPGSRPARYTIIRS